MDKLIGLDAYKTCVLVFTWFPMNWSLAVESLESYPNLQFNFLKILSNHMPNWETYNPVTEETHKKDDENAERYIHYSIHLFCVYFFGFCACFFVILMFWHSNK